MAPRAGGAAAKVTAVMTMQWPTNRAPPSSRAAAALAALAAVLAAALGRLGRLRRADLAPGIVLPLVVVEAREGLERRDLEQVVLQPVELAVAAPARVRLLERPAVEPVLRVEDCNFNFGSCR